MEIGGTVGRIIFFFINELILFFLAAVGLGCCPSALSSCVVVASLVTDHGIESMPASGVAACRLSISGSLALECRLSSHGPQA